LYGLRDCVYHIPETDVLVLYKRSGRILTIYDIVGPAMPVFADIYPYICDPQDQTVEFFFMTDKLRVTNLDYAIVEGNGAHVHGRFPLERTSFMFPFTSQA